MLLYQPPDLTAKSFCQAPPYDGYRNCGRGWVGRESTLDCGVVMMRRVVRRFSRHWHSQQVGRGLQMMMPQIAAAIVGAATAGGFLVTLAPDFSADCALAVIACFS
jgi:hypothetical protein